MKKFYLCLFILTVFGAFVFYRGWTQFKVKPENVGIVISKTSGVSQTPVKNGEFSWYWEFLLPTNAELKTFSITPLNTTKTIKGQLPSGDVYTSIYASKDNFSYEFNFSISLTVGPEAVLDLYKENKITNSQDLTEYLDKAADSLVQLAADFYLSKAQDNIKFRPENVRRDDLIKSIKIYKEYPELEITTFALTESKIPDFALYEKTRTQFAENIKSEITDVPEITETQELTDLSKDLL